jgi:hypothetical protein
MQEAAARWLAHGGAREHIDAPNGSIHAPAI